MIYRFIIAVLLVGNSLISFSQENATASLKGVEDIYSEFVGLNQLIFNGRFYRYFYGDTEGDQYLIDQELRQGDLTFQGVLYPDVTLNYDIYNDYVFVLWDQAGFIYYILPNQNQVESFVIDEMNFIRIADQEIEGLTSGFYQEVYQGKKYQFLVKSEKKQSKQNRTESTDKWYKFIQKDYYYIVVDGKAMPLKSKKDLIQLQDDGTVANYIKQNKLKISPRRGDFLGNVVEVLGILEGN